MVVRVLWRGAARGAQTRFSRARWVSIPKGAAGGVQQWRTLKNAGGAGTSDYKWRCDGWRCERWMC